jgi:signal transduction histidine kinase
MENVRTNPDEPALRSREELMEEFQLFKEDTGLRRALDAIPQPILVLNRSRQLIWGNLSLVQKVGRTLDAMLGERQGDVLNCEHVRDCASGCGHSEHCDDCGAALSIRAGLAGETKTQECSISRGAGDAMELRVTTSPVLERESPYVFCAIEDISHEKRREALERIFFHDIINSLGAIQGAATLLCSATESERPQLAWLLSEQARTALDEVVSQRELSAAESGQLPLQEDLVLCGKVLEEVAANYRVHQDFPGREISVLTGAESLALRVDVTLLRRVLGNMTKNALEASRSVVTLSADDDGDGAIFRVHNQGAIPPAVRLQIFKRSFSTKGFGRGLGTYAMKLFGERILGGRVWFDTSVGEGTTFCFWLPHRDG